MPTLFEYLDSINTTKDHIMVDAQDEKDFIPFMVTRGLSFFSDTVLYAAEMNRSQNLTNKMVYEFYINSIPKRKRFSKWHKADKASDDLKMVADYFVCSYEKAKIKMTILTEAQIDEIRTVTDTGGRR